MKMTLGTLLEEGKEKLEKAGVPDPLLDARFLLLDVFDMNFASFLVKRGRPLTGTENGINGTDADSDTLKKIEKYRELISKREMRIPLQQLTGVQEFMGLEFYVNEHVLIPRQDTETLVELVLQEQQGREKKLLDLCTGSGCIAISLAVMGGYRDVTAADLSEAALKVAAENADHLLQERRKEGCRFTLRRGDLFEALKPGERFDVLTSNPPYIPTEVVRGLEPEVKDHEPWMALDGTEDGLAFYRRIVHESKAWLNPGACIYLEIGYDQGEAVSRLLEAAGFCNIQVIKDLPGLDRVVRAEIKK